MPGNLMMYIFLINARLRTTLVKLISALKSVVYLVPLLCTHSLSLFVERTVLAGAEV